MKKEYITRVFEDWDNLKIEGIWLSGTRKEGEFKRWYDNGQLFIHRLYKNGKEEGEYKRWHENGELNIHCFYNNGEFNGEYKIWSDNGELFIHLLYKDDKEVKDYLE